MDEKPRKAPKIPEKLFDEYRHMPGALLPVLYAIQEHFGYVPEETAPEIAEGLNLFRAEIYGVIGIYFFFRSSPSGRNYTQICRAGASHAIDSTSLKERIESSLSLNYHQTTVESG